MAKTDTLLESSRITVDSYAKPDIEANYQGRLLARQSGFFDPVNYRNHFVTILGTIQGEQPGFINKVPCNLLEVNMQGIQVWHLREVVIPPITCGHYGYGAFWLELAVVRLIHTNVVSNLHQSWSNTCRRRPDAFICDHVSTKNYYSKLIHYYKCCVLLITLGKLIIVNVRTGVGYVSHNYNRSTNVLHRDENILKR